MVMTSLLSGCARSQDISESAIQALLDSGMYERAEELAHLQSERLIRRHGADSTEVLLWSDMLLKAALLNGKGALPSTRALAERVVERKQSLPVDARCCFVRSQINLADALVGAAEFERASAMLTNAVSELSARPRADPGELAEALEHLGTALILNEKMDEALVTLRRSLEVRRTTSQSDPLSRARPLLLLGWALQRKGEYAQAGTAIREAVAMEAANHPNHPAYAEALSLLGLQLWFEGHLQDAIDTSTKALEVAERTLRSDHPTVALALRRLGANVGSVGDLSESRALKQRALAMAERSFGPRHYETWAYLNDLAHSSLVLGEYVNARELFARSLEIAEGRFGPWHDSVATAVHNLALVDASLGDYAKARIEQGRATSIWERVLGPEHTFVAVALTELAGVYRAQGAPSEALPLLQRALSIREHSLGQNHREVARTLTDLAATFSRMGQPARAQEMAARSLSIWQQANMPDAPDFATALALYGELQTRRGDAATARTYLERALAIRARVFGPSHPVYADTQISLAVVLARQGNLSSAIQIAQAGEATGREHLRLMVRSLPERESLNYAASRPQALDLILSLVGDAPSATANALDALIRSRALVLDEMVARVHPVLSASAEDVTDLRTQLSSAQQRLASLVVRGPEDQAVERYSQLLDEARAAKEETERVLAARSARFHAELSYERAGLEDVRRAMPAGSVVLSFVRYGRAVFTDAVGALAPPSADVPSYLAFVIGTKGEPVVLRLGAASVVDALIARWRFDVQAAAVRKLARATDGSDAARISGARLRRAIWDPIAAHVESATTLFVVPDDALSLVPLAALPGRKMEFVLEEAPVIHYLTAERDLVQTEEATKESARSLLAIGGPAFDDASTFSLGRTDQISPRPAAYGLRSPQSHCDSFQTMQFGPLAGTVREVQDVAELWRGLSGGVAARVLVSNEATEHLFKQEAPRHQVIHLATHGFFLGASCPSTTDGLRAVGGLVSGTRLRPQQLPAAIADSPLLLSGVALAGANRRASAGGGEDDGILTAEEVSGLDLSGVQWAVLSACNTGVGKVSVGEGVFGLRRAFQIAGVRTVIMSLWPVEDDAARLWMHSLYEGRLKRKLSTAAAVHEANLNVLHARRAAGQSTHPFYWAAFVAAGDWR